MYLANHAHMTAQRFGKAATGAASTSRSSRRRPEEASATPPPMKVARLQSMDPQVCLLREPSLMSCAKAPRSWVRPTQARWNSPWRFGRPTARWWAPMLVESPLDCWAKLSPRVMSSSHRRTHGGRRTSRMPQCLRRSSARSLRLPRRKTSIGTVSLSAASSGHAFSCGLYVTSLFLVAYRAV